MVTAAGVIGIVWGALALLFGLVGVGFAFAISTVLGLVVLIAVVVGIGLLVGGIFVVTGVAEGAALHQLRRDRDQPDRAGHLASRRTAGPRTASWASCCRS